MITVNQFIKTAHRLGFIVYQDKTFPDFYYFYYGNEVNINLIMGKLVKWDFHNDVTLFTPVKYNSIPPSTRRITEKYLDLVKFEKDLIEHCFTMRKYKFEYEAKRH